MRRGLPRFTSLAAALCLAALASACGNDPVVDLDVGPSPVTAGSGACLSMPFPRTCFRGMHDISCTVGPKGDILPADGSFPVYDNGCVGAVLVIQPGHDPDPSMGIAAWQAPYRVTSAAGKCCAEEGANNRIPHIASFDPKSRALFVRTAAPVTGPTQVAFTLAFGSVFMDQASAQSGYVWRFYVGGEPTGEPL